MSQLGILQNGVTVTPPRTNPLNLGQTPPDALPPNTAKLSRAQANSALMGTVASTLASLPQAIVGSYLKGKEIGNQQAGHQLLSDVVAGKAHVPAGVSIDSGGALSYKAPPPNSDLEREDKQTDISLKNARIKALGEKAPGIDTNPLAAAFNNAPESGDDGRMDELETDGPVLGTGTSYGYKGDTFGGRRAADSTTGPSGNALDHNSLAVSPDIEKILTTKGYKLGDTVTLNTQGGGSVQRRWDDRTAQYDPTGKWSVDDSGNFIDKLTGKASSSVPENRRLPALTGRFDFHADQRGNPSQYSGVHIIGVLPPKRAGVVNDANKTAPLPTGGALSASDAAPASPALAPAATADSEAAATPIPTAGAPATGALAAAPAAETADATAPSVKAANAAIVGQDGTINAEAAVNAPRNGAVKVADAGHHGGPVYKYPGSNMFIEDGADNGVYGYPMKSKGGAVTQVVLKKPDPTAKFGTEAKKMMSDYSITPMPGESEPDFLVRARQAGREADKVPPSVQTPYFRWATSLQSNPVIKNYITAREQQNTVEAALSNGLTPAAALATIDSFTRAMSGGRATQGMTHILSEAQPLRSQLENLKNRVMGTPQENAILTPELAGQIKTIIGNVAKKSKEEAEAMMEGDKDHWSTFDVPPHAVEKTYHRIFGGKTSSLDMMGMDPAKEMTTAPAAAPLAPGQGTPSAPVNITTKEQYDALPPGAYYKDSKGKFGRKTAPAAPAPAPALPGAKVVVGAVQG